MSTQGAAFGIAIGNRMALIAAARLSLPGSITAVFDHGNGSRDLQVGCRGILKLHVNS
jgi:hypothetical protein